MKINPAVFKEVQTHIVEVGIYKLTDRMDVTVYSEHGITQSFGYVVFTNAWICVKEGREWTCRGFHCGVLTRIQVFTDRDDVLWVDQKSRPVIILFIVLDGTWRPNAPQR